MIEDRTQKHRFHGRRKGKTLTAYRQKLLSDEFPNYKINDVNQLSIDKNKLNWLEIGFGNGEFLSIMSQRHPEINFFGCEPFINGIAALIASLEFRVKNLHIWDDNARILIDSLPDQSLDRIYLLNPDPWPKLRHHKRRFIQKDSLSDLDRVLKPGGELIMSTDVYDLATWMYDNTTKYTEFEIRKSNTKNNNWLSPPLDWPLEKTRYMKKALGGETIYWLQFFKKP